MIRFTLYLVGAAVLLGQTLFGQQKPELIARPTPIHSMITGTVTDSSGAIVPNASVLATNRDTKAVYAGGTTGSGKFVITLPAGKYDVAVRMSGFPTVTKTGLTLEPSAVLSVDLKLILSDRPQFIPPIAIPELLRRETATH